MYNPLLAPGADACVQDDQHVTEDHHTVPLLAPDPTSRKPRILQCHCRATARWMALVTGWPLKANIYTSQGQI